MKVFFIGGADFSASTMVGSILGAEVDGPNEIFHVGEIQAFFRQESPLYGDPRDAASLPGGDRWLRTNHQVGYAEAYSEILRVNPSLKFLIDSSKVPDYLTVQLEAGKEGFKDFDNIYVIITYRPFEKIWHSGIKRGLSIQRNKDNIMRYKKLLEIIDTYKLPHAIINVENLIVNPKLGTLAVCREVGLPYFEGKEKYWLFNQFHLYGNRIQRDHMKDKARSNFEVSKVIENKADTNHPFLNEKNIKELEARLCSNAIFF